MPTGGLSNRAGRGSPAPPRPYIAAIHVHSRFSNGEYDVTELAPGRYYYRLQADAQRLNRVLSNPVFVTVEEH